MDDASLQRSRHAKRLHAALCVGVLSICATVYVLLANALFEHWSRLTTMGVTVALWLIPWIVVFTLLLRVHARDPIERKNLDAVIRDRDLLRTLIDGLPDFIYVKDVHCRFILANRFCCEAMGTTAEQLVGRTDFDFYPPELAQNFFEDEQKVLNSGEPLLSRQEDVRDQKGETITILTTKVPLRDARGEVLGIMGIGRNITARVAAERQLRAAQLAVELEMRERERMAIELRLAQKLESVGRLAAGIAHEINTPIQYVSDSVHFLDSAFDDLSKLFAAYRDAALSRLPNAGDPVAANLKAMEEACELEFLSTEVPKAFDRTQEGIRRVTGIVRAMKEFAHPDANEQRAADINRALTTTLTVARSEYRHAAQVQTQLGPLPEVICNLSELNQVFLNLIVNAAHAIVDAGKDATTGLIEIETSVVADQAQIRISDNGCGIPRENVDKIFDPFFTTKEIGRGTGQGLAIARAIIVDKHAGLIEVDSEIGVGTRFMIRIPIGGRACQATLAA